MPNDRSKGRSRAEARNVSKVVAVGAARNSPVSPARRWRAVAQRQFRTPEGVVRPVPRVGWAALGFDHRQIAVEPAVFADRYAFFHRRSGVSDGGQSLPFGLDATLQDQHPIETLLDFGADLTTDFIDVRGDGSGRRHRAGNRIVRRSRRFAKCRPFIETVVRQSGFGHATTGLVGRKLRIVVEEPEASRNRPSAASRLARAARRVGLAVSAKRQASSRVSGAAAHVLLPARNRLARIPRRRSKPRSPAGVSNNMGRTFQAMKKRTAKRHPLTNDVGLGLKEVSRTEKDRHRGLGGNIDCPRY